MENAQQVYSMQHMHEFSIKLKKKQNRKKNNVATIATGWEILKCLG